MKIVVTGKIEISRFTALGSHHYARGFARLGHDVLHLANPMSPFTLRHFGNPIVRDRLAASRRGLHQMGERLQQIVPFSMLPLQSTAYFQSCDPLLGLTFPPLRNVLKRSGFDSVDVIIVEDPQLLGIWKWIRCRAMIYRPIDLYGHARFGVGERLKRLERNMMQHSAAVVCTSEPVAEHVRSLLPCPLPVEVIENGVAFEHFSKPHPVPPEYSGMPAGPRAVYIGSLDYRFNMNAVHRAAAKLPHVQFVLIGLLEQERPSDLPMNVHLLGPRNWSDSPGYLQHADIGLLPMNNHGINAGRSPMKYYEYLAAGLPIVSTSSPELVRRATPFVHLFGEDAEMPVAIENALSEPRDRDAISQLAAPYDWNLRTARFVSLIDEILESKAEVRSSAVAQKRQVTSAV